MATLPSVAGWISSSLARRGDLLILRFEDVRSNLEGTIARCLNFLGKSASPEIICNAVHNNTLAKMREKEDRAATLPKSPAEEGRWIGRGSVGGWRGKLTEQQLEIVDAHAWDLLAHFGYPTNIFNLPLVSPLRSERNDSATATKNLRPANQ